MITIFNRKELLTTFDMSEQARVRELLNNNQIDYRVKTGNHMNDHMTRSRMGSVGQKMEYSYQYTIYVKKADYDKALYCIRNK